MELPELTAIKKLKYNLTADKYKITGIIIYNNIILLNP